jgi:hypothetical protein
MGNKCAKEVIVKVEKNSLSNIKSESLIINNSIVNLEEKEVSSKVSSPLTVTDNESNMETSYNKAKQKIETICSNEDDCKSYSSNDRTVVEHSNSSYSGSLIINNDDNSVVLNDNKSNETGSEQSISYSFLNDLNNKKDNVTFKQMYFSFRSKNDLKNLSIFSRTVPFKGQEIENIRKEGVLFKDPLFKCSVKILGVENTDFLNKIAKKYRKTDIESLEDLNRVLIWKRCPVIAFNNKDSLQLKNEFVLDKFGRSELDKTNKKHYCENFSIHDVFQGTLGDCYLIGAFMAITKCKDLLAHIIPIDNSFKSNMNLGAYHFRLWRMGFWHDIVIDDYLLVNPVCDLILVKNSTYPNEFWAPLLEKAFAK